MEILGQEIEIKKSLITKKLRVKIMLSMPINI